MGFNFTRETTALQKEKNTVWRNTHTYGRKENAPDSAESRPLLTQEISYGLSKFDLNWLNGLQIGLF